MKRFLLIFAIFGVIFAAWRDRRVAQDAYDEYVASGRKSRPIEELWEEV